MVYSASAIMIKSGIIFFTNLPAFIKELSFIFTEGISVALEPMKQFFQFLRAR